MNKTLFFCIAIPAVLLGGGKETNQGGFRPDSDATEGAAGRRYIWTVTFRTSNALGANRSESISDFAATQGRAQSAAEAAFFAAAERTFVERRMVVRAVAPIEMDGSRPPTHAWTLIYECVRTQADGTLERSAENELSDFAHSLADAEAALQTAIGSLRWNNGWKVDLKRTSIHPRAAVASRNENHGGEK